MFSIAIFYGLLLLPIAEERDSTAKAIEHAYAYNRDGMIAMSKARFEEAIDQFQKAADLVPDYGITRRGLLYTPNFMIAWANEKLGRDQEACRYFHRFLELAPGEWLEPSKADHAKTFLTGHCPDMPQPRIPSRDHTSSDHHRMPAHLRA